MNIFARSFLQRLVAVAARIKVVYDTARGTITCVISVHTSSGVLTKTCRYIWTTLLNAIFSFLQLLLCYGLTGPIPTIVFATGDSAIATAVSYVCGDVV